MIFIGMNYTSQPKYFSPSRGTAAFEKNILLTALAVGCDLPRPLACASSWDNAGTGPVSPVQGVPQQRGRRGDPAGHGGKIPVLTRDPPMSAVAGGRRKKPRLFPNFVIWISKDCPNLGCTGALRY